MEVLGGGLFLMSEVPADLRPTLAFLPQSLRMNLKTVREHNGGTLRLYSRHQVLMFGIKSES